MHVAPIASLGLRVGRWLMWRVVPLPLLQSAHANWLALAELAPNILSGVPSHDARLAGYRHLGARIGAHTSVHRGCQFYAIENLRIGRNTVINQNVILDARRGLSIGRNVSISEQAIIFTLQHDLEDPGFSSTGGPVVIGDHVFIGARAIILPNVTVGQGAAVAAGAVVTKDVPPYTVVGGMPARPLRRRSRDLQYRLDYRRRFF